MLDQSTAVSAVSRAPALLVFRLRSQDKNVPLSPEGRGSRANRWVQGEGADGSAPTVSNELKLIGRTTDEARDLLEKYLDDAFLAGLPSVRVIHGKGTGALRRAVEELLTSHPLILSHRPGEPHEGGAGATVAVLGQS